MSFHRRHYDKNSIISSSNSMGFSEFNRWILSPDAHISSDAFSSDFINVYCEVEEEQRHNLYLSLKESEECAINEIKKYIKE
jgi:hypothetical protein